MKHNIEAAYKKMAIARMEYFALHCAGYQDSDNPYDELIADVVKRMNGELTLPLECEDYAYPEFWHDAAQITGLPFPDSGWDVFGGNSEIGTC